MYRHFLIALIISLALNQFATAQQFISPLNAPLIISGAFGEPRENHFHTGVDFTTRGRTGIQVYASAGGYVSRIRVSPYGYGKAIYIMHPNGLMTVYGHLSRFNDVLQKYVTEQQYKLEKNEVDLYPNKDEFIVKQGDVIAYSGNTGGSTAPHLHFEIRDASGESYPLNPLAYHLPVKDSIPPVIRKLVVYNMDVCCDLVAPEEHSVFKENGIYKLHPRRSPDTLIVTSSKFALGVKAMDFLNGSDSDGDFGVYSIKVKLDNTVIYDFTMDRIDFSETNYANCEIDYGHKLKTHEEIYRCYLLPGNKASIYKDVVNSGIMELADNSLHKIEITASDFFNNKAVLSFYILNRKSAPLKIPTSSKKYLAFSEQNNIKDNDIKIEFPPNTFYDNIYFKLDTLSHSPAGALSDEYYLHDEFTAVHEHYELYIKPKVRIDEKYRSKVVIVNRKSNGGESGLTSTWEDGWVKAKPGELGRFFIGIDTIAPAVKPKNFKPSTLLRNRTLEFEFSDNLSGTKDYDIFVDGKWTITEFDAKTNTLICNLGKKLPAGEHSIRVVVSDNVNNKKTYKYTIRL